MGRHLRDTPCPVHELPWCATCAGHVLMLAGRRTADERLRGVADDVIGRTLSTRGSDPRGSGVVRSRPDREFHGPASPAETPLAATLRAGGEDHKVRWPLRLEAEPADAAPTPAPMTRREARVAERAARIAREAQDALAASSASWQTDNSTA